MSAVLAMQKKIGNQATARLLQRKQALQTKGPIQRMADKDFTKQFGASMGIKSNKLVYVEVMLFNKWLKGVIRDITDQDVAEFIADDSFTNDVLADYINQYKEFKELVGPEEASNKLADVPVPQGMFLVASQSELEAGLYTDGVSPCVAVGFQIKINDEEEDVLALGHFDSFTAPSQLAVMYNAALQKAGRTIQQVAHVTISLSGGVNTPKGKDKKELNGPELFKQLVDVAEGLKADASDKIEVIKRRSVDNKEVAVRIDSEKGMKRYAKSLVDPTQSEELAKNPQALKASKFMLQNAQSLTNDDGQADQFGLDYKKQVQDSVAKADESLDE
ncbi:hypothetical protein JJB07_06510 [Tumebacillus sp. ITR2]|uniref:Uncharacterized protein n=1 Tax=Tumebacillus amylolyticus TaxID=2801339 RepID=A0ABS1J7Q2_9BACL|nr:hypothetical protein [Tumebacillus amylolyticus]MBL0386305.1 hypothetical protein [Tumebacillus amylolyticus]